MTFLLVSHQSTFVPEYTEMRTGHVNEWRISKRSVTQQTKQEAYLFLLESSKNCRPFFLLKRNFSSHTPPCSYKGFFLRKKFVIFFLVDPKKLKGIW